MDYIICQVHRMYNAEEGTTLAQFASFTKYCLLMAIPFIGWTIVEIFFCVLKNPLIFAGVWILLALVGFIAEFFISFHNINRARANTTVAHTVLGQVGLEIPPMPLNLHSATAERDVNNNHNVDIVQVNADQVRVIPDVGTQTPQVSEPGTPTTLASTPSVPSSIPVRQRSEKVIPDVGTQTPQDNLHTLNVQVNKVEDALLLEGTKPNGCKTASEIIPITESGSDESDLANEFEIQEKILDAATTWIMPPTNSENNNELEQLKNGKNVFVEDGDPFLELNSMTNSELLHCPKAS